MYFVYILKSELNGRFYIGHTQDIDKRLDRHNKGLVRSTKPYRPWQVVRRECYESRSEAYRREMQIKSYKSGKAFNELV
jgi:putative endonuclease